MSEILYDAKYSIVDISTTLSINEETVIDRQKNITANDIVCNRIYYNELLNKAILDEANESRNIDNDFLEQNEMQKNGLVGEHNIYDQYNNSFTLAGEYNECTGLNSVILGGKDNENNSSCSVVLGGQNNQCIADNTTTIGINSVAEHANSLVWNSDEDNIINTTNKGQCIFNALGGMMVRLPSSNVIWNEHIEEGFGCFCWDPIMNKVCIKTKQRDVMYISYFSTDVNEIGVDLTVMDDIIHVDLNNPDNV